MLQYLGLLRIFNKMMLHGFHTIRIGFFIQSKLAFPSTFVAIWQHAIVPDTNICIYNIRELLKENFSEQQ